jgi:hypothetical protein
VHVQIPPWWGPIDSPYLGSSTYLRPSHLPAVAAIFFAAPSSTARFLIADLTIPHLGENVVACRLQRGANPRPAGAFCRICMVNSRGIFERLIKGGQRAASVVSGTVSRTVFWRWGLV